MVRASNYVSIKIVTTALLIHNVNRKIEIEIQHAAHVLMIAVPPNIQQGRFSIYSKMAEGSANPIDRLYQHKITIRRQNRRTINYDFEKNKSTPRRVWPEKEASATKSRNLSEGKGPVIVYLETSTCVGFEKNSSYRFFFFFL